MFATFNQRNMTSAIGWILLLTATIWTGLNAWQSPVDLAQPMPAKNTNALQYAAEHGFELAGGSWQFPELNWTISQQLTNATPADWFQQHESAAAFRGSAPLDPNPRISPETELDAQILALVRSLMLPAADQAGWNIYAIDTASLRGLAISSGAEGSEQLRAICLQWPAESGQWTQLELARLPTSPALYPEPELPLGTEVTAQRTDRHGQVQVQVLDLSQTPNELQRYLKRHGWTITQHPSDESIFWAGDDGKLFEFTCQSSPSGRHSALMRDLDRTQPTGLQVAEKL